MVTSVTHNFHPPETYAWEICYGIIPKGLRQTYSISLEVEGEMMLGMANVPSLIGDPQGLSSEHRKQP